MRGQGAAHPPVSPPCSAGFPGNPWCPLRGDGVGLSAVERGLRGFPRGPGGRKHPAKPRWWIAEGRLESPSIEPACPAPDPGPSTKYGFSVSRNLALSRIYGVNEETVTDATAFLSPKVAQLYRWWRSHAQEGAHAQAGSLPLRRAFDIAEHTAIIPDLFLVEVLSDGRFLMKLEGERAIELFGVNRTGSIITQGADAGEYGHALAEYYQSIVDEKLCRRCTGNMEHMNARRWVEFESIDCPLSRDGHKVDFILGVSVGVQEKRL